MKKFVFCFVMMALVLAMGANCYSAVSLDILNPVVFSRSKGEPVTEAYTFSSTFGGPATLKVINGDLNAPSVRRVTNATIMLNGKIIFGPLKLNLFTKQLEATVPLIKGNNTLRVISVSLPGGRMTIEIDQTITNVTVVPTTVRLASPGSTFQLKVMGKLSDGTAVDISGPSFGTSYSSADTSIATALSDGLLTANALGQTTVTVSNDDFLANVPVSVAGASPTLSDLLLSRTLLPVPREYEQFIMNLTFNFSDPNMDVQSYNFTLTGPSGIIQSSSNELTSDQPTGSSARKFLIDSSFEEGLYQVGIEVFDAIGNSSGVQAKSFTIDPAAPRFLEISGVEPASGKPGDKVVINGIGFEAEPQANDVSFFNALGRAEILSATPTQLEVIVPEGIRTGTVGLMTSLGRTDSPESFTIVPTITLSPASTQLLIGSSADFSCVPSGTDTYNIVWSINGQTAPDPSLGAIDNRGHFTAPSSLPSVNPLTLKCTSFDVPTLYAETSIIVVAPAPMPGQDLVTAAIGGQMTSNGGEVAIDIPPGSMATDTIISVEWVDPVSLPAPTEDSYNLAAVKLEPSGLQFSQPVTLIFALRNWQEPGTSLTVYLADEASGTLSATGKTATVDESGLKASTMIDHFSTYYAVLEPPTLIPMSYFQKRASDYIPYFNQFSIYTSDDRPFLEGLSVPIVVKRALGPGTGIGPFLSRNFSLPGNIGPLVQPSADGWELGTVIKVPVIPSCHEGQTYTANLVIGFANIGLSQTITIPFTIQCLNELVFSRWTLPNLVPEGAWVEGPSPDGTVTVNVSTEHTYRFSRLYIGEGGILKVNYTYPQEGVNPAVIEVTGDVTIKGKIQSTGDNGSPGGNGDDHWDGWSHHIIGGSGGWGGFPNAGKGGTGGPGNHNGSPAGENGFTARFAWDYGAGWGGPGGLVWDRGSWLSFLNNTYSFVRDVVTIVASSGTSYLSYVYAIQDGYGAITEGMKLWENSKVELQHRGGRGGAPITDYASNLSSFSVPLAGGGGGGAGKMKADPDKAGGGGGGGGGGAPSLKIVTPGQVIINWGGSIIGKGGNGGHGGDGSGGWQGQAAPGGGGGGGNGAQIFVIASRMQMSGLIDLSGGVGGASGRMKDDDDAPSYFIKNGFGESGRNGVFRFDGDIAYGNSPWHAQYYKGPQFAYGVGVTSSSPYCRQVYNGSPGGYSNWCGNLQPGLNTFPAGDTALHPWQKKFVFYYPGWQDSDGDGLHDGLELALGTNPSNPDSDGDGLNDGLEAGLGTDPLNPDTDGDGYSDGYEVANRSNPKDPASRPAYSITVTKAGVGGGVVTSSPSGMDCGSTCEAAYTPGSTVNLQASPAPGSYFTGWSGGWCSGTSPLCRISNIRTVVTVVANFEPQKTLVVTKTGSGSGAVTSIPSGLDCGSICQATFIPGSMVALHAVASPGFYFTGWSGGGCSGTASLCTITINADTTVTANFEVPIPGALMTTTRYNHTATLLPDGTVLIVGGRDGSDNILPSSEIYDPAASTFGPKGSMASGRVGHTATLLPNDKVLLVGGEESNNPNPGYLSTAELYDPTTGTFAPTGDLMYGVGYMRQTHVGHTATLLPFEPDMVLIIGGWPVIPQYGDGSSEIYNVDGGWFDIAGESYRMITERSDHTATLLLDGRVLVAGGMDTNGNVLNSAELYTINEVDAFSATGSIPTARAGHTATLLPDGKVLVVGGWGADDVPRSSWALYDPAAGMFSTSGSATARAGHTATLLNNGKILIAGGHGYYADGVWFSADLYDPATATFAATGSMTTPRADHTATLLNDGKVLIAGGYDDINGVLSSAEIYDPETGTFNFPERGPSITVVSDTSGDLLLRNCDSANPSMYCSLPPGASLSLPGYFDIKTATIEQVSGEEVELSISLNAPIPAEPPYSFVSYNWQFQGGCVNPSPKNKAAIAIYWNGTTWEANWVVVSSCTPQTIEMGSQIPFEFTETKDGVKVRVALADLLTAIDPGEPLYWHASVRRIPTSYTTFPNLVPVDFAPNVMAFNPLPSPTFIYPESEATWEPPGE
jgi:hypothetical protein